MRFPPNYRFPEVEKEFEALLSENPCNVRAFAEKERHKNFTKQQQGIYAFTDPEDKEIVYIGKSTKHSRGVGGRARHHERPRRGEQRKLGVDQEFRGKIVLHLDLLLHTCP
jgi:hypothetical protein